MDNRKTSEIVDCMADMLLHLGEKFQEGVVWFACEMGLSTDLFSKLEGLEEREIAKWKKAIASDQTTLGYEEWAFNGHWKLCRSAFSLIRSRQVEFEKFRKDVRRKYHQ